MWVGGYSWPHVGFSSIFDKLVARAGLAAFFPTCKSIAAPPWYTSEMVQLLCSVDATMRALNGQWFEKYAFGMSPRGLRAANQVTQAGSLAYRAAPWWPSLAQLRAAGLNQIWPNNGDKVQLGPHPAITMDVLPMVDRWPAYITSVAEGEPYREASPPSVLERMMSSPQPVCWKRDWIPIELKVGCNNHPSFPFQVGRQFRQQGGPTPSKDLVGTWQPRTRLIQRW